LIEQRCRAELLEHLAKSIKFYEEERDESL